jgi:hypothetical protein
MLQKSLQAFVHLRVHAQVNILCVCVCVKCAGDVAAKSTMQRLSHTLQKWHRQQRQHMQHMQRALAEASSSSSPIAPSSSSTVVVWLAEGLVEYLSIPQQDRLLCLMSKVQKLHNDFCRDLQTARGDGDDDDDSTVTETESSKASGRLVLPLLSPTLGQLYGMKFGWKFSDIPHVVELLQTQGWSQVTARQFLWGTLVQATML